MAVVGVEEVPQYYPSACSFTGFAYPDAKRFVRVDAPQDANAYNTVLISDQFFKQIAPMFDYVAQSDVTNNIEAARNLLNECRIALSNATTELNALRSSFQSSEGIENRLQGIGAALDSLATSLDSSEGNTEIESGQPAESGANDAPVIVVAPDSTGNNDAGTDGPVEPTVDSQLDGVPESNNSTGTSEGTDTPNP